MDGITIRSEEEYIMIRQKVTITNPTGLHLRPAGMFCNIASRYKCKVELCMMTMLQQMQRAF